MVVGGALAASALLGSCKKSEPPAAASESTKAQAVAAKPKPSLYDAQGRLLPSKVRVEWLEIPVGFERQQVREYGRHVLFESSEVPFEKASAYLSERMLTGQVDETQRDIHYKAVMPVDGRADSTRLDVLLTKLPGDKLQIDIEPLTYHGVKPLSVEEAKKALREEARHAE